jgi:polysaccharide biosynthesis/export protein
MQLRKNALLLLALMPILAMALGCQAIDFRDPQTLAPVPPELEPPREMAMQSLPVYRIEPPDMIQIEVLKLVPLSPYRIESYDVLQINALDTFIDAPINGYYMVEAEGSVDLGPSYGTVRVIGMTVEEANRAVKDKLLQYLGEPQVSLQLSRASSLQPISGQYLIKSDGTVNLLKYGQVYLAGMTIAEAKIALENHLKSFLDSPEVAVDMVAFNSKFYYVITQGAGQGDSIVRIPVTGNETVLDAISQINGLSQMSSKNIWIARPAPAGANCQQRLPVNWDAIVQGGETDTNYQIMPHDRLYISEDKMIATTSFISRVTAPMERLLGFTSLIASTTRSTQLIGYRQTNY